jgi:hypothetical protein
VRAPIGRRDEAVQFGRRQGFDRFRIICQPAKNLFGYSLGFRFVGEILLNPPASHVIGSGYIALPRLTEQ